MVNSSHVFLMTKTAKPVPVTNDKITVGDMLSRNGRPLICYLLFFFLDNFLKLDV